MIINSLKVIDAQIAVKTPNGMFGHRYTDDGYGEMSAGTPWGPNAALSVGQRYKDFYVRNG